MLVPLGLNTKPMPVNLILQSKLKFDIVNKITSYFGKWKCVSIISYEYSKKIDEILKLLKKLKRF